MFLDFSGCRNADDQYKMQERFKMWVENDKDGTGVISSVWVNFYHPQPYVIVRVRTAQGWQVFDW